MVAVGVQKAQDYAAAPQRAQVFVHFFLASSVLHQLADGVGALILHQVEPKPAISLSSHTGGAPHLVASHVLLQRLFAFLHFLFFFLH